MREWSERLSEEKRKQVKLYKLQSNKKYQSKKEKKKTKSEWNEKQKKKICRNIFKKEKCQAKMIFLN